MAAGSDGSMPTEEVCTQDESGALAAAETEELLCAAFSGEEEETSWEGRRRCSWQDYAEDEERFFGSAMTQMSDTELFSELPCMITSSARNTERYSTSRTTDPEFFKRIAYRGRRGSTGRDTDGRDGGTTGRSSTNDNYTSDLAAGREVLVGVSSLLRRTRENSGAGANKDDETEVFSELPPSPHPHQVKSAFIEKRTPGSSSSHWAQQSSASSSQQDGADTYKRLALRQALRYAQKATSDGKEKREEAEKHIGKSERIVSQSAADAASAATPEHQDATLLRHSFGSCSDRSTLSSSTSSISPTQPQSKATMSSIATSLVCHLSDTLEEIVDDHMTSAQNDALTKQLDRDKASKPIAAATAKLAAALFKENGAGSEQSFTSESSLMQYGGSTAPTSTDVDDTFALNATTNPEVLHPCLPTLPKTGRPQTPKKGRAGSTNQAACMS